MNIANIIKNLFHKDITVKESKPVFKPLPELTNENATQLKTSYPKHKPYPSRKHIKPTPTPSEPAINAASGINLPDIKTRMKRTEEWTLAFKWYNKYIHKGNHPLGMGCHPCWNKVYDALKKAKS